MLPRRIDPAFAIVLAFLSTAAASRAPAATASWRLSSPQDGRRIAPGATVSWSIAVSVSPGENSGLALAVVDLVQARANPARFDLDPALEVPPGLEGFASPSGISNPGDDGRSGYLGLQRGAEGGRDLVQIGGAQNTFGQPGRSQGLSVVVTTGIGQGAPIILARGRFEAPAVEGTYTLSLANALANTLIDLLPGDAGWRIASARTELVQPSFSFTVGEVASVEFVRGDANTDGSVDISDAIYLLRHLFHGTPVTLNCPASADTDHNARLDLTDAVALVTYLFQGGKRPDAPFPSCGADPQPGSLPCDAFSPCL